MYTLGTGERRAGSCGNPIVASVCGAFSAIIFAYASSYFLLHFGLGVISVPGQPISHGPATLLRAGLNLYAMQHVVLVGSGQGTVATILLPMTVWVIGPALALIIGGFIAAKRRVACGRWNAIGVAVFSGILYALIQWSLTPFLSALVDPSALPSTDQWSFNPPNFLFKADSGSALVAAMIFGVIFTYLGALIALRRGGQQNAQAPGKWWVCGKAVLLTAIVIQLALAVAFEAWMLTNPPKSLSEPSGSRIAESLPTTVGGVYLLVHGATVKGVVESRIAETVDRPWDARVRLYRGISQNNAGKGQHTPLPKFVRILSALVALGILLAGWRAVKAGSVDGSLPTALRITILHSAYLVFLIWACRISWGSVEGPARMKAQISAVYGADMLYAVLGVFVLSFIGAIFANRMNTSRSGFRK